jgi:N-acetylmuramic acid 6-phosphate etherase
MAGLLLGIECGGTHTVAICADRELYQVKRLDVDGANLRLLTDAQLLRHFRSIGAKMPEPGAVCIGMAGARTASDFARIRTMAGKVWPRSQLYATNDLETALMAAQEESTAAAASVLILSGTGSCCFGRRTDGRTAKVGGWGHILGDKGSGFEIGLRALKATVFYYDRDGVWPKLGARLLRALQLNEPDELIDWVRTASKPEVAALAMEVFKASTEREKIARDILKAAAHSLARDGAACAGRLAKGGAVVNFILSGGILSKQPRFRREVEREVRSLWPKAAFTRLHRESAWGAVILAKQLLPSLAGSPTRAINARPSAAKERNELAPSELIRLRRSPTEERNPRSMRIDKMSMAAAIRLMLNEETRIAPALLKERRSIEKAVQLIVRAFRSGGRLFYVGAGTSGRLGVLDASECPPTFQSDPQMVQGIMAGGQRALWEAVEGAEDDPEQGARAVTFRKVGPRDVVVGIAASGRTPFVWGALEKARKSGARTILLCFNPFLRVPAERRPDVMIAANVGPELLTGSTRLKAGTATKLVLNIFTTLAMIRMGKVQENLMIDVKASNRKLRDRAVRILQELTGTEYDRAFRALEVSRWQIRRARRRLHSS